MPVFLAQLFRNLHEIIKPHKPCLQYVTLFVERLLLIADRNFSSFGFSRYLAACPSQESRVCNFLSNLIMKMPLNFFLSSLIVIVYSVFLLSSSFETCGNLFYYLWTLSNCFTYFINVMPKIWVFYSFLLNRRMGVLTILWSMYSCLYSCMMVSFFKSHILNLYSACSLLYPLILFWRSCHLAAYLLCCRDPADYLPKYGNLHLPLLNPSVIFLTTPLVWQNNLEFQPCYPAYLQYQVLMISRFWCVLCSVM